MLGDELIADLRQKEFELRLVVVFGKAFQRAHRIQVARGREVESDEHRFGLALADDRAALVIPIIPVHPSAVGADVEVERLAQELIEGGGLVLGFFGARRDGVFEHADAVHGVYLCPCCRVAPVVARIQAVQQPEPRRIVFGLAIQHGLEHRHVFKEFGFFGETGGGDVDAERVAARDHAGVEHLDAVAVYDLRCLVDDGATGVLAVAGLFVVSGQRLEHRLGVASLHDRVLAGIVDGRDVGGHGLDKTGGRREHDASLVAGRGQRVHLRARFAKGQLVQRDSGGECGLASLARDENNHVRDHAARRILFAAETVDGADCKNLERLQQQRLTGHRPFGVLQGAEEIQHMLRILGMKLPRPRFVFQLIQESLRRETDVLARQHPASGDIHGIQDAVFILHGPLSSLAYLPPSWVLLARRPLGVRPSSFISTTARLKARSLAVK